MRDLTYAKVGGPPRDWTELEVRDLGTGDLIDAVEVNVPEGWAIVIKRKPGEEGLAHERIEGRFAIERRPVIL